MVTPTSTSTQGRGLRSGRTVERWRVLGDIDYRPEELFAAGRLLQLRRRW
jgi:hypothetical protein